MPSWGIHLATTKKILEKINIKDENDYIFGNILPDILNGYLIKDVSNIVTHKDAHYDIYKGEKFSNYKRFYAEYNNKLNNKVVLGYLIHLMTDNLWNKQFYNKKVIFNDNKITRIKVTRWKSKRK